MSSMNDQVPHQSETMMGNLLLAQVISTSWHLLRHLLHATTLESTAEFWFVNEGCVCCALVKRQIDILELKDLQKEYILARSRLTLAQQHPPSAAIAGKWNGCVWMAVNLL